MNTVHPALLVAALPGLWCCSERGACRRPSAGLPSGRSAGSESGQHALECSCPPAPWSSSSPPSLANGPSATRPALQAARPNPSPPMICRVQTGQTVATAISSTASPLPAAVGVTCAYRIAVVQLYRQLSQFDLAGILEMRMPSASQEISRHNSVY